ncbi:RimK family alpha-L-glutamate ligase [Plantactinospora siamensis]|uniref:RimK family alpha-L-glutamate ligase n=1 Tax=Plantactinospora siamensis TaxID=555372 RepID=A0ABV6NY84_9ACTN
MTSSLRRMVWVFPDRESTQTKAMWQFYFWDMYAEIAAEMGLTWTRNAPSEITVSNLVPGKPRVYVKDDLVTPEDTLFITALYSLPYQAMDVFNQYAIYAVLEQLGFFLTFPSWVSQIGNDKLASLLYFADSPVPGIPTVRIGTGPDVGKHGYEVALEDVTYPVIVKPAGWCGGGGLNLARNADDVRGLASLAQGGDTSLVIQPYLGDGTVDYRVYVIGGEAHPYVLTRTPEPGSPASNASRGGSMAFVPIPPELAEAARYFAQRLTIPYFCVDFLHDGERFWFSELEPDGVIAPDFDDPQRTAQRTLTRARWTAYRDTHARWLATPGRSTP